MSEIPEIDGKPAAKIHIHLEEKVGLPAYSNVSYGGSVTRFVEDDPDKIDEALLDAESRVEGWMKDYYRREVQELVENAASK